MFGLEFGWGLTFVTMLMHITAQFMAKHEFQSGRCARAKLGCVSLNLKTKTQNHEQPRCTTLVRPFVPTICNFLPIGISNKSINLLGCAHYTVGGSRAIKLIFIDT